MCDFGTQKSWFHISHIPDEQAYSLDDVVMSISSFNKDQLIDDGIVGKSSSYCSFVIS